MVDIHPTSQHIALYLFHHGEKGKDHSKDYGPKKHSLVWALKNPINLNTSTRDLYIEHPILEVSYIECTLGSNPLKPNNSSTLEIQVNNAEDPNMRGLWTNEYSLSGIPRQFTVFDTKPKEGEIFNVPMEIINPAIEDKVLRELVDQWKQIKYHEFLEYVFQQLIQR